MGLLNSFLWPSIDDLCSVPIENIITKMSISTTRSGLITSGNKITTFPNMKDLVLLSACFSCVLQHRW